jgi:hypothetical protein
MALKVISQQELKEVREAPVELTEKHGSDLNVKNPIMAAFGASLAKVASKRRLENEDASADITKRSKPNTDATSNIPQEKSQDSGQKPGSSKTPYQRSTALYRSLSKVYYEMFEIDAELGNDETSRLMAYIKR